MDQIRINPNECVICRKDTAKQLWLESDKNNSQPTKATHESCLLQLLHVRPTVISKIQSEDSQIDEKASTNTTRTIAKSYCEDCSKRNHELFDLVTEIYQLNLKLGRLREFIKTKFKKSFSVEGGEAFKGPNDSSSEQILQRNKLVRFEIASGLNLIIEQELDRERLLPVTANYSSGESNSCSENQGNNSESESRESSDSEYTPDHNENKGSKPKSRTNIGRQKKRYHLRNLSIPVQRLPTGAISELPVSADSVESQFGYHPALCKLTRTSGTDNRDFIDEILLNAPSSPKDSAHRSSENELHESNKSLTDSNRYENRDGKQGPSSKVVTTPQSRYYCPVEGCARQKPFQSATDLECHRQKVHEGVLKPYKCSDCELSFADEHGRRKHKQFVHLRTRGRVCEICGRRFPDMHSLKVHMASHSTERPHRCMECNSSFKIERSLKTHIKRVHRNERPHSCDHCGKSFYTGFKLKNHIQSVHFPHEKPFICEICGRGFPIQGYLYMHKRMRHKIEIVEDNDGGEAANFVDESSDEGSSSAARISNMTETPRDNSEPSFNADAEHSFREYVNPPDQLTPDIVDSNASFATTTEKGSMAGYLGIQSPHSCQNSTCPMDLSHFQTVVPEQYPVNQNTQFQGIPASAPPEIPIPTTMSFSNFMPHHFII